MTDDHYLSVDYIQLVPFLIKKVQKQKREIEEMKNEMNDLKSRMERLEQLIGN